MLPKYVAHSPNAVYRIARFAMSKKKRKKNEKKKIVSMAQCGK